MFSLSAGDNFVLISLNVVVQNQNYKRKSDFKKFSNLKIGNKNNHVFKKKVNRVFFTVHQIILNRKQNG